MGDRGNIVVRQWGDNPPVFLYAHWGGSQLPSVLQRALKRRERWEDHSYLTRIIFCEMVKGCEAEETGFGISTAPPDNEHDYLVVDPSEGTIALVAYDYESDDRTVDGPPVGRWTMSEYIALPITEGTEPEELRKF